MDIKTIELGKREERTVTLQEARVITMNQARHLVGYAAVFNELSEDLGGFQEKITPGAFTNTIQDADVRALFNHDPNIVLGRTKSGTLALSEDEKGLRIDVTLPDTQAANDLVISVERGDIDQMSFGFRVVQDQWLQEGDQTTRILIEVELFDISPVTFPAYPQTSVQARDLMTALGMNPEEDLLQSINRMHDKTATAEDRTRIENLITKLQCELNSPTRQEPEGEGVETQQLQAQLDLLKRRLEIAKRK